MRINITTRLQHWMDSVPGQTFLNYAYSWGACVVILGTLFKLLHLPGANIMLFIGMGTEVVVFFLSAFDRPFDKNEKEHSLSEELESDEQIAANESLTHEDVQPIGVQPVMVASGSVGGGGATVIGGASGSGTVGDAQGTSAVAAGQGGSGGVVIIGSGGGSGTPSIAAGSADQAPAESVTGIVPPGTTPDKEAERLAEIIRLANDELLRRAQAVLSPEMEDATQVYIEKLRVLTETLAKVDAQSIRMVRDHEEMENLSRALTGITTVYELQLKGASAQVASIDQITEQTKHMAGLIEELNNVYKRMIEALTVNMKQAAPRA